ncbi:AAA family ATPase [Streptomyces sp. NPDC046977]|uniref:AAA family ATPase n=1 Tax=Streptomyces sp. NPDC046977 TaxID=3154703 RepID=UPI00340C176A
MTATFTFAPATRERALARIGIQGPAGSGKTLTLLRMATRLANGGPIGLIDTERDSALTYAKVPGRPDLGGYDFEHLPMNICSPENLIAAVEAAKQAGIVVLGLDSWSHFWAGRGGLLQRVDEESRKPEHRGGSYTAWGAVNPLEQEMLDALLNYPGHVLVTMRTKTDYEMEGRTVTKVGVKTIQREGAEYELGLIIDMVKGTGTVTKTRYQALDGLTVHHPGEEMADAILEHLGQGVDPVERIMDAITDAELTLDGVLGLDADATRRGLQSRGVLHPGTGAPTTLNALMTERLVEIVLGMLDAEGLTYEGALTFHRRAQQGGWGGVPAGRAEDGSPVSLLDVIVRRGKELAPVRPASQGATGQQSGQDGDKGNDAEGTGRQLTDHELALAASSGHPDVEAAAAAVMDDRERTEHDGTGTAADPDDGSPVNAVPDPDGPSAPPQLRNINNLFAQLDMGGDENRGRRLTAAGLLLERQRPERLNDLTYGEAEQLLTALFSAASADQLRDRLNTLLQRAQASTGGTTAKAA